MIDAITFDFGGFPSIELQLVSSEGLAPLPMPTVFRQSALPQPSPDAVRRFQAAMEDGVPREDSKSADTSRTLPISHVTLEAPSTPVVMPSTPTAFVNPEISASPEIPVVQQTENPVHPVKGELPVRATQDLRAPAPLREISKGIADAPVAPQAEGTVSLRGTQSAEIQRAFRGEAFQTGLEIPEAESADTSRTLTISHVTLEVPSAPVVMPSNPKALINPEISASPETPVAQQTENPVHPVKGEIPVQAQAAQDPRAPAPLHEISKGIADAPVAPQAEGTVSLRGTQSAEIQGAFRGEAFQTGLEIPEVESADTSRTLPISHVTIEAPSAPSVMPSNPKALVNPEIPVSPGTPVAQQTENPVHPVKGELPVQATQDLRAPAPLRETDNDAPDVENVVAKAESASAHVVISPSAVDTAQHVLNTSVSAVSSEVASARTDGIVEAVNKIVESIAEEISITPSIIKGEDTIHITLKPTILDGSEIALSAKDGTLTVTVTPATHQAEQAIVAALPRLESALAEHIPAFRQLAVVLKKGKSNEAA